MVKEKQKPEKTSKKNSTKNSKQNLKKHSKNQQLKKSNNNKTKKMQADVQSARIKKAKMFKKIIRWTSLIGILLGIVVFVCTSKLFKICKIEIIGNNQISQEAIIKLSELKLEKNIFLSNISKAEKQIKQNPYVKEVDVKRELPDKIKIEIIEKQKVYMLEFDGNYAYLDIEGYVLEITTTKLDNTINLQGFLTPKEDIVAGKYLIEKDLEKLEDTQKIINSAEKNLFKDKISGINITNKNYYTLTLQALKKIVYIGDISNLPTKMLRTKDILDKTMDKEGKIFVNGNFNKGFDPYFREELNN